MGSLEHMSNDDLGIDPAALARVSTVLTELTPEDNELLTPPAGVWAGIKAALEAGSPKEAPAQLLAGTVVEYWIDDADVVVDTGSEWSDFAVDNDAAELADAPSDRLLWDYFDRDEVRDLWQLVVGRVRATGSPATVPLRCDAPDARRWFEMTVTPEADGRVHFRSVLAFEEQRPAVALLDPHVTRDADAAAIDVCSWCGRGRHDDEWLDIEQLVRTARLLEREELPPISQGICSSCRDDMSADLVVSGTATA